MPPKKGTYDDHFRRQLRKTLSDDPFGRGRNLPPKPCPCDCWPRTAFQGRRNARRKHSRTDIWEPLLLGPPVSAAWPGPLGQPLPLPFQPPSSPVLLPLGSPRRAPMDPWLPPSGPCLLTHTRHRVSPWISRAIICIMKRHGHQHAGQWHNPLVPEIWPWPLEAKP